MSDSTKRFSCFVILVLGMGIFAIINNSHHLETQRQLAAYQDSVNVLIEVNKTLHAAQTMYSDAIVGAMGVKPEPMKLAVCRELQEVNHGKD